MSRIREHFSTTALILSIVALVFALMGGAYAASHAQNKKSVAKRGPRGPKGPAGPAGPAGPSGPAGAKGDKGDPGANGSSGGNGAPGKSVSGAPIAAGGDCGPVDGVAYTLDGVTNNVCNGQDGLQGDPGDQGPQGEPWTPGGTLPPGATETGAWSIGTDTSSGTFGGYAIVPISFTIPLASGLGEAQVHLQGEGGFSDHCDGEGQADPGHLCVYGQEVNRKRLGSPVITNLSFSFTPGTDKAGAFLVFEIEGDNAFGFGSWAVTGCGGTGEFACS
jgi:hypothetical protein